MDYHDGYSLTAKAQMILGGLGIPKENWSQPIQLLSGGYRMRTVLGKLLLEARIFSCLTSQLTTWIWIHWFGWKNTWKNKNTVC